MKKINQIRREDADSKEEQEVEKTQIEDGNTLELDHVNKHECMKNIKRCLDKMQELFNKEWKENGYDNLPSFMQILYDEIMDPETHLNIKIFIFKLLVNN